jgi:SAM-dependent methyltransferase
LVDIVDRYVRHPERAGRKVVIPAAASNQNRLDQVVVALRPLLRQLPGQRFLRPLWHRRRARVGMGQMISYGHRVISASAVTQVLTDGWKAPSIPQKQRHLVDSELQRMYQGDVVPVYRVAAEAVRATGLEDPLIVEIGCASGYYNEVLSHLLGHPVRYMGIDYSAALVRQARQYYPNSPFVVADATTLPLRDNCCDILFSPALLMHVPAYEQAVRESVRLSRSWCIFHRTPVVKSVSTVYLSKHAYDVPVVEIVFNENELLTLFGCLGLQVKQTFGISRYDLPDLPEPVEMKTYVCYKAVK